MMRHALLLCFVLSLSACFGGGAVVPEDRFYRLSDPPVPAQLESPLVEVLAIAVLQSDPLLRERAILYSEATVPLTIRRYHYHFWTHSPGQMIQEQLLDYLRAAGLARQVIRHGEQARVDAQISGHLKRFERQLGAGLPRARVTLELQYRPQTGDRIPVIREYDFNQRAADNSLQATVIAFSTALHKVYQAFVSDLRAAQR